MAKFSSDMLSYCLFLILLLVDVATTTRASLGQRAPGKQLSFIRSNFNMKMENQFSKMPLFYCDRLEWWTGCCYIYLHAQFHLGWNRSDISAWHQVLTMNNLQSNVKNPKP